jgi:hypothetical protein
VRFLHELGRFGVSAFAATAEEIEEDFDNARPR